MNPFTVPSCAGKSKASSIFSGLSCLPSWAILLTKLGYPAHQVRRASRRRLALADRRWLPRKSAGRSRKRPGKRGGQNECAGATPCDRGEVGVKKSLLVCLTPLLCIEGNGRPLAARISGANTPDTNLLALTLDAIVVERPQPTAEEPQHLCLDKGYANAPAEAVVLAAGYMPHIAPIKPSAHRRRKAR